MFLKRHKALSAATLIDLKHYIDRCFPAETPPAEALRACEESADDHIAPPLYAAPAPQATRAPRKKARSDATAAAKPSRPAPSLQEALAHMDESFSETLLRKIDEKHMTDARCYKKAQIDRKLFSKIRSQRDYRPSKATALSFALALELSLDETRDLLMKAGYALSHSSKADVIVEYCILHGIYDKFLVNEALYEFDQPLL